MAEIKALAPREELYLYYVSTYENLIHVKMPACSAAKGELIETGTSLLDLSGFSMSTFTKETRELVKMSSEMGANFYPEIMHKMYIVNAGWGFWAAWAVIKPFIDKKTALKINLLGTNYQKELFKQVPAENVPRFLGGECECEGGCLETEPGPWDEFPGDDVGELGKARKKAKMDGKDYEQVVEA